MTPSTASPPAAAGTGTSGPGGLVGVLWRRQPVLTALGLAFLLFAVPAAAGLALDGRTVDGANVWLKPLKFLLSLALFALTTAWLVDHVAVPRRRALPIRIAVWTIVGGSLFEITYIAVQAARGEASHFNETTAFLATMFALMGVVAVLVTGTTLILAWEIARHARPGLDPALRLAVILGSVLTFVFGVGAGAAMAAMGGHGIGGVAGGPTVPLFGWSMTGGDLRAAHFLGIHAQQVVPAAGILLAALLPSRARVAVVAFVALYAALITVVFVQALEGLPLFPAG
jgi:hypothetical protein